MRRHLGIVTAATLLALGSPAAVATPDGHEPTVPSTEARANAAAVGLEHRADRAEAALAEVQAMLGDTVLARAKSSGGADRDATMALRDLAALKDSLSPADQARAERFLARPTQGVNDPLENGYTTAEQPPQCGDHVCVHYVATTVDAATPEFVALALETLEHLHSTYVAAGYRAPKSDLTSPHHGPNGLTDVYLADIGPTPNPNDAPGVYGYCTTDDPKAFDQVFNRFDMSAYCVLDNDYQASQFPKKTPTENLQVTAAHEYFHAVQFAYDWLEDIWFMEGTATWVEDEVYDTIDDNRQYLHASPLSHPTFSLDSAAGKHEYGAWIFFRYLSERFPTELGELPKVVLNMWRRADADLDGPDRNSTQAVRDALAANGTTFPATFARFGAINRHPRLSYNEGTEGTGYPAVAPSASHGLSTSLRTTNWRAVILNHMANATIRFKPSTTLTASNWRLRLNLNLPRITRGSAATVQVYLANGSIQLSPIRLNAEGNATRSFPFAVGAVKYVEVTLTNASTRFRCWRGTNFTCQGTPLDNRLAFSYRGTAFRS